ncbi:hypothetical protein Poli38472_002628 [Pythium oligandrum]|uniref:Spermidine synthase n=1 Tax=Pythium oligandrum TaxID=41045 RepID=A0A8K1CK30_PYTOL|nr:hypothetical protein Poli38472_002628 [Pythium oligandrum]|eukprot:TMW63687.1 hypothetical protein Poli38472_002628 [Pythium oligandrum]
MTHASASRDYQIVSRLEEDDSVVSVVRHDGGLLLLYDTAVIGAEFDHPQLRNYAAFPGFAIMQCVAYIDRTIERAIQIGLGIGTVPSFLRNQGIPTDVVEISDAVVRQAASYFQYERCDDDEPEECANGKTYVTDGLAFIENAPSTPLYDAFTIDVYTGWNPVAFFVREVLETVRDKWLTPRGVLVLNFVGYIQGEHSVVPKSIYRTLQSLYPHVKAFREFEDRHLHPVVNIVFFASKEPFTFYVPTTGMYRNPVPGNYFDAVRNFQKWEVSLLVDRLLRVEAKRFVRKVFTELKARNVEVEVKQTKDVSFVSSPAVDASIQVLTVAKQGQHAFQRTHLATQKHMQRHVLEKFPATLWEELGLDVTKQSKE